MKLEEIKQYIRVDYDDDDSLILLIYGAVIDEMKELIDDFDEENITNRQKLLILSYVKEIYDNRDRTASKPDNIRYTVQSLLLKEMLR